MDVVSNVYTGLLMNPTLDLDRSNLGNARLQGFPQDVLRGDPTGNLFDWTNTAFFISYVGTIHVYVSFSIVLIFRWQIVFPVPAIILSKLCSPRVWLGCATMGWGLASTLLSTTFNSAGAIVCRVFLGMFEAGFAPGST